jgi:hypothetical protein
MAEWIYFLHSLRENFAETMTEEEEEVWGVHFERFKRLLEDGVIVLVGPTLGRRSTPASRSSRRRTRKRRGSSWKKTPWWPAATRAASCGRSAFRCCAAGISGFALVNGTVKSRR